MKNERQHEDFKKYVNGIMLSNDAEGSTDNSDEFIDDIDEGSTSTFTINMNEKLKVKYVIVEDEQVFAIIEFVSSNFINDVIVKWIEYALREGKVMYFILFIPRGILPGQCKSHDYVVVGSAEEFQGAVRAANGHPGKEPDECHCAQHFTRCNHHHGCNVPVKMPCLNGSSTEKSTRTQ